jgi:hypothetical protein
LSCQQPYFGSVPYNYRVTFDYPWSQQPAYRFGDFLSPTVVPIEEVPVDAEPIEAEPVNLSKRKPKTTLRR